jgi:hypothetical protein
VALGLLHFTLVHHIILQSLFNEDLQSLGNLKPDSAFYIL